MPDNGGWGGGGGKTKSAAKNTGWQAWFNVMPSPNGLFQTLHVLGCIDVGNESDGAVLKFAGLEKSNPPNLLLEVNYRTILIPRESGDNIVRLHYSQAIAVGQIGSVKIFYPDDDQVLIDFIPLIQ